MSAFWIPPPSTLCGIAQVATLKSVHQVQDQGMNNSQGASGGHMGL